MVVVVNCPDDLYLFDDWKRFFEEEWWICRQSTGQIGKKVDIRVEMGGVRMRKFKLVGRLDDLMVPRTVGKKIFFDNRLHPSWLVLEIRQMMAKLLADRGKVMLHASGVLVDDSVWLIAGSPGSGKSTALKNLMPSYKAVAEDVVVIESSGKGVVCCWPTPLNLKVKLEVENRAYPVAGVLIIKKGEGASIKKLGQADGLVVILDQVRNYANGPCAGKLAMEVARCLANRVFEVEYSLKMSLPKLMKKLWQK